MYWWLFAFHFGGSLLERLGCWKVSFCYGTWFLLVYRGQLNRDILSLLDCACLLAIPQIQVDIDLDLRDTQKKAHIESWKSGKED